MEAVLDDAMLRALSTLGRRTASLPAPRSRDASAGLCMLSILLRLEPRCLLGGGGGGGIEGLGFWAAVLGVGFGGLVMPDRRFKEADDGLRAGGTGGRDVVGVKGDGVPASEVDDMSVL